MNDPGAPVVTVRAEWTMAIRDIFRRKPNWGECLLHYTGLIDGKSRTLQEIADDAEAYGFDRAVTRERIRQVLALARRRLTWWARRREWSVYAATTDRMRTILPCSPGRFVEMFGYPNASNPVQFFHRLSEIADSLRLDFDYLLESPSTLGPIVVGRSEQSAMESLRNLNKLAGSTFGRVDETSSSLECPPWLLASAIRASDRWEFLDDENLYFWKRPKLPPPRPEVTGNKILTTLCRLFAAGHRARSVDLEMSIVRRPLPREQQVSAHVIELIARRSGLFEVEDGEIRRGRGWAWLKPFERDRLLMDISARHGSVVTSRVLYAELMRGGLSKGNASVTVSHTPFLIHAQSGVGFKKGIYRFVVSQEPRAEQTDKNAASRPTVRIRVTSRVAVTGRIYGDNRFGCDGSWVVRNGTDLLPGRVVISGRMIDGLSPVIAALDLRKGDVLEMRPSRDDGVLVVGGDGSGARSPAIGASEIASR